MKVVFSYIILLLLGVHSVFGNYGSELRAYDFGTSDILRDEFRDRVYCSVPSLNGIVVIDAESLNVTATIFTGSNPQGLSLSANGDKLYVANLGTTEQGIAIIDLDELVVSGYIATVGYPSDVCAGSDNVIYTLEGRTILAYDTSSGAQLDGELSTYSGGVSVYGGLMSISADRQTLYYYQTGLSPSSWYMIDVSNWPGTKILSENYGSNGQDMEVSSDGNYVSFASGSPYSVQKFSAADPRVSYGTMSTGPYPRAVGYSYDGSELFVVHSTGHIDVWSTSTFVKLTEIMTTGDPRDLESDRKGCVLFSGSSSAMYAYYIGRDEDTENVTVTINNAVEIRWDSQYGELYQVQWRTAAGNDSVNWQNLGGSVLGTGLTMSVYDTTRNHSRKFYRVQQVTP